METKGKKKINKVMKEFKEGDLHSGSKKGPVVKNPKQAIAISLSEARKSGAKIPKKKNKIKDSLWLTIRKNLNQKWLIVKKKLMLRKKA